MYGKTKGILLPHNYLKFPLVKVILSIPKPVFSGFLCSLLRNSFSGLHRKRKLKHRLQFLSYGHQIFFGQSRNVFWGHTVSIFSIFYFIFEKIVFLHIFFFTPEYSSRFGVLFLTQKSTLKKMSFHDIWSIIDRKFCCLTTSFFGGKLYILQKIKVHLVIEWFFFEKKSNFNDNMSVKFWVLSFDIADLFEYSARKNFFFFNRFFFKNEIKIKKKKSKRCDLRKRFKITRKKFDGVATRTPDYVLF